MDSDLTRFVEATGVSVPLAARIVGLILDSGASQVEADAALAVVRSTISLLPVRLVAEDVGAPDLHSPAS